jgi:ABC-type bacteriocin/lantibiotic exporter with double-glycine peptidase domain
MMQWFKQEHPASCVSACLRMVMHHQGALCTEAEIRQRLGNPRYGLTLAEAAVHLSSSGATTEWYGDWSLDDLRDSLRSGAFPIVGVERRYFGHPSAAHAVVIVNIRADEIEMLDPLDGPAPRITLADTFVAAWRNAGQEVLILNVPFFS